MDRSQEALTAEAVKKYTEAMESGATMEQAFDLVVVWIEPILMGTFSDQMASDLAVETADIAEGAYLGNTAP